MRQVHIPMYWRPLPVGVCDRYEPNDAPANAYGPLRNGITLFKALCAGDSGDNYFVDVTSLSDLRIGMDNIPAGTDYDLSLYLSSGGPYLARSANAGSSPEEIEILVDPGRYIILVLPATPNRSSEPYRLNVSWS